MKANSHIISDVRRNCKLQSDASSIGEDWVAENLDIAAIEDLVLLMFNKEKKFSSYRGHSG